MKELSPKERSELLRFRKSANVSDEDKADMDALWHESHKLCETILALCPESADRSAAIRYLRLCINQANASICYKNV